jgi:hypothetical protein
LIQITETTTSWSSRHSRSLALWLALNEIDLMWILSRQDFVQSTHCWICLNHRSLKLSMNRIRVKCRIGNRNFSNSRNDFRFER